MESCGRGRAGTYNPDMRPWPRIEPQTLRSAVLHSTTEQNLLGQDLFMCLKLYYLWSHWLICFVQWFNLTKMFVSWGQGVLEWWLGIWYKAGWDLKFVFREFTIQWGKQTWAQLSTIQISWSVKIEARTTHRGGRDYFWFTGLW